MSKLIERHQNKIVLVLGPHRSGTSLLAGCLEQLGLNLGGECLPPTQENPKGYFENEQIVYFNERLLNHLGGKWDNFLFDYKLATNDNYDWPEASSFIDEAKKIIETNFTSQKIAAIKDPRMCQLLPFWIHILNSCGYQEQSLFFIYIIRNPIEISMSHQSRKQLRPVLYATGETIADSIPLWLSLTHQSLREAPTKHVLFLSYDNLLDSPHHELSRISRFLSLDIKDQQIDNCAATFIDTKLKRQTASPDLISNDPLAHRALDLYARLKSLTENDILDSAKLSQIISLFSPSNTCTSVYHAGAPTLTNLLNERRTGMEANIIHLGTIEQQNQALNLVQGQLQMMNTELLAIRHSISYRLTKPMRLIRKLHIFLCQKLIATARRFKNHP